MVNVTELKSTTADPAKVAEHQDIWSDFNVTAPDVVERVKQKYAELEAVEKPQDFEGRKTLARKVYIQDWYEWEKGRKAAAAKMDIETCAYWWRHTYIMDRTASFTPKVGCSISRSRRTMSGGCISCPRQRVMDLSAGMTSLTTSARRWTLASSATANSAWVTATC
jgi:hypothetical protein